jgi:hypothetical protein
MLRFHRDRTESKNFVCDHFRNFDREVFRSFGSLVYFPIRNFYKELHTASPRSLLKEMEAGFVVQEPASVGWLNELVSELQQLHPGISEEVGIP